MLSSVDNAALAKSLSKAGFLPKKIRYDTEQSTAIMSYAGVNVAQLMRIWNVMKHLDGSPYSRFTHRGDIAKLENPNVAKMFHCWNHCWYGAAPKVICALVCRWRVGSNYSLIQGIVLCVYIGVSQFLTWECLPVKTDVIM